MCVVGTRLRLVNLDPYAAWLEAIGFIPHTRCQWGILHIRWYDYVSNDEVPHRSSPRSLIYRTQSKTLTIRSCFQTSWWCPSKPNTPDLLRSSRGCPARYRPAIICLWSEGASYRRPWDGALNGSTGKHMDNYTISMTKSRTEKNKDRENAGQKRGTKIKDPI